MGDQYYQDYTLIGSDLNEGFGCLKELPRNSDAIGFNDGMKEDAIKFFKKNLKTTKVQLKGTQKEVTLNYVEI